MHTATFVSCAALCLFALNVRADGKPPAKSGALDVTMQIIVDPDARLPDEVVRKIPLPARQAGGKKPAVAQNPPGPADAAAKGQERASEARERGRELSENAKERAREAAQKREESRRTPPERPERPPTP
jgi:hypothetical protein